MAMVKLISCWELRGLPLVGVSMRGWRMCSLAGSGWSSQFNLTTLNGSNGFAIEGLNAGDSLGYSVSTAGDINGDGTADLVLGAHYCFPMETACGYGICAVRSGKWLVASV